MLRLNQLKYCKIRTDTPLSSNDKLHQYNNLLNFMVIIPVVLDLAT
jgi:hypothetical protein